MSVLLEYIIEPYIFWIQPEAVIASKKSSTVEFWRWHGIAYSVR